MNQTEFKALIKSKGFSVRKAAELIGISERMIRYYTSENDPRPIPKKVILAISSLNLL